MTVEEFFIEYKIVCGMFNCNNCPLNENFNNIDNLCIKTNDLYPDGFTVTKMNALISKMQDIIAAKYEEVRDKNAD